MQPPPNTNAFNQPPAKTFDHSLVLKGGFFAHFCLTSLVFLSKWTPNVYAFYNGFLIAGFWIACTTAHIDLTLLKLMAMEGAAAVLDIFVVAIYYNESPRSGADVYLFWVFVIHLLARFGLMFTISRIRKERKNVMDGGATDPMRADYQQVQSSMGQLPAQQQVGYDYGQPTKMEPLPDLSRFAPTNPYHHQ
ncbi:hypothetical protein PRIPAC_96033 [Pristionchus pacificus]|uniref:Uncharacterized protein n=1 Tax=Pristionchus pacificus TaxID=54126 RepID=A0A454XSI0_PRIPA|nr:hypothetical protein PRIPAC_96033 [Pristionchus pacificus]|eukprot:PDM77306.1 hypothetical protein PRIPAC_40256 [Pristionchus pacificus]